MSLWISTCCIPSILTYLFSCICLYFETCSDTIRYSEAMTTDFFFFFESLVAGEVSQQLHVLVVILGLISEHSHDTLVLLPSTHMYVHTSCNSSSRRSNTLFWFLWASDTHALQKNMCQIPLHIVLNFKKISSVFQGKKVLSNFLNGNNL